MAETLGHFKEGVCFLIGRKIYGISQGADFSFCGRRFGLVKNGAIANLERGNGLEEIVSTDIIGFAELVANRICKRNARFGPKRKESVMPLGNFFVYRGRLFPLIENKLGSLKIGGRNYSISNKFHATIEEIEKRRTKAGPSLPRKFYDERKMMGFEIIGKTFYVVTKIEPFVLYERLNRKHYRFGRARVGSALIKNGNNISFGPLKVLDSYSHPSLQSINKPFQKICVGSFSYNSIRERHPGSLEEQLLELMRKGRNVLTKEYRSRGKPYHFLTEVHFAGMETNEVINVTNR